MIRPPTLTSDLYPIARKPALGYESHLLFSLKQSLEPGSFEVTGANTGTFTLNQAEATALDADPMELLALLDTDVDCGATNLVLTVTGTDHLGAAATGTATFAPPAHSAMQDKVFGRCWSVQVESAGPAFKKFKTVTGVSVACAAQALGAKFVLVAIPALTTFQEILCKTQVNITPKVPMPHSIACGRDMAAYTKPGEIPIGAVSISAKNISSADGLARVNGRRVTGLLKTVKEDLVTTDHMFLLGLIVAVKLDVGDGVSEQTWSGEGQTEETAFVIAP
jgi:hypothetical protein